MKGSWTSDGLGERRGGCKEEGRGRRGGLGDRRGGCKGGVGWGAVVPLVRGEVDTRGEA